MAYRKLLIFLYFLHIVTCDWVADWLEPVQDKLYWLQKGASRKMMEDDVIKMVRIKPEDADKDKVNSEKLKYVQNVKIGPQPLPRAQPEPMDSNVGLKIKLEDTLNNAEELLEKLQLQIAVLERKERLLKEAIANGRSGVSTVTVTTINNRPPRIYFVRDGTWSICNGMVQYPVANTPVTSNMFDDIFNTPRCIGQEIMAKKDPCVFHSVIKYEIIPERRKLEYIEEDYYCFKPAFNRSLEQYLSVPKIIINNTCHQGVVRSLEENILQCGSRMLSEYTYYPNRAIAASLYPLEYCTEKDGACKLIIAWHISNTTVENFEFLKNDVNFKTLFVKPSGPYIEHIL